MFLWKRNKDVTDVVWLFLAQINQKRRNKSIKECHTANFDSVRSKHIFCHRSLLFRCVDIAVTYTFQIFVVMIYREPFCCNLAMKVYCILNKEILDVISYKIFIETETPIFRFYLDLCLYEMFLIF